MTRFISALLAAGALLATIDLVAATASPKVVSLPLYKSQVRRHIPRLERRANTVQADLTNEILLYFLNVTVGTPAQSFSLQLDTGSSDIWFPASDSNICREQQDACDFGSFDSSASSTFSEISNGFEISYVDGSKIQGDYITDVLNIGSTKLTNMTMASATTASRGIGIMGIGYQAGESIAETQGVTYPNVINELKDQGFIESLSYSLWLNDLDSNTGSILFGGVDSDKYHGDLIALPVQKDGQTGNLTSFTVALSGLTITSAGSTTNLMNSTALPAILDSGTTLTYLPDDIATSIFDGVGVVADQTYGNVVHCSLANDDAVFSFSFGGDTSSSINVPISEFVTPLLTEDGSTPLFKDGTPACAWGIDSAGSNPILFGDTFLRSAYVVYDLENNLIGLANTNFNSTSTNIKAITSGIPGATTTATAVQVTQTFSGNPQPTASSATATGGTQVGGGSTRSATFHLTTGSATATGGSSGSTASAASTHTGAAASVRVPTVQGTAILAGAVAVAGFLCGGSLMFFL